MSDPQPPSPSLDNLFPPPSPPLPLPPTSPTVTECFIQECDDLFPNGPPMFSPSHIFPMAPPPQPQIILPEMPRGRSRSPSRSPLMCGNVYLGPVPRLSDYSPSRRSYSPESRSPSPRPRRRRYSYRGCSRTPSPVRRRRSYDYPPPPIIITQPAAPPPPPITICSPSPPPPQPPVMWPPAPIPEPVDILTFHHNKNMAYAPAAKDYDGAIDNVLELWPDLREFDRDRIQLFVGCSDQLVRVPKMAWQLVLCDFPRYEVIHVQVDQPAPPPQYQGDGKGNWPSDDKVQKKPRSRGLFSKVKRIFWRR